MFVAQAVENEFLDDARKYFRAQRLLRAGNSAEFPLPLRQSA
jgi:hypothetical protein